MYNIIINITVINMKTDTSDEIIKYIKFRGQVTGKDIADHLGITRQALFKQFFKLIAEGKISKIGKPPKVFYFIKEKEAKKIGIETEIDSISKKVIENNFLIITPSGERKEGLDGFIYWCQKTNQPVGKTAKEYAKTLEKYNAFKKAGFIDGMAKLKATFPKVYLDNIFYLAFYSIERFGKTKLGQMLLYAKQSQSKNLMKELILDLKPRVEQLIKKYKIDGVGFIPPTVKRETQFMRELERNLHLRARTVSIVKIKTEVVIPQKTLNKLSDRVENARKTIVVNDKNEYNNILLLDDAVGSGATLNETAAQIRAKRIVKGKIIGLAITGSFKGFDVISEV